MATKDPKKFKIIKLTKSHTQSPLKNSKYETKINKSHEYEFKKTSNRIEQLKLITSELKERENNFRRTSKILKKKKECLNQKIFHTDNEITSLTSLLENKYEDFLMQTIDKRSTFLSKAQIKEFFKCVRSFDCRRRFHCCSKILTNRI